MDSCVTPGATASGTGQRSPYPLIRSAFPGDDHESAQTRKDLLDILLTCESIDFGTEAVGLAFGDFVRLGYADPTACEVLLEELSGLCGQLRRGFLTLETVRAELEVMRTERAAGRS